jgi:hypothetical protein
MGVLVVTATSMGDRQSDWYENNIECHGHRRESNRVQYCVYYRRCELPERVYAIVSNNWVVRCVVDDGVVVRCVVDDGVVGRYVVDN